GQDALGQLDIGGAAGGRRWVLAVNRRQGAGCQHEGEPVHATPRHGSISGSARGVAGSTRYAVLQTTPRAPGSSESQCVSARCLSLPLPAGTCLTSRRPKIIRPAAVCSTLVTAIVTS